MLERLSIPVAPLNEVEVFTVLALALFGAVGLVGGGMKDSKRYDFAAMHGVVGVSTGEVGIEESL